MIFWISEPTLGENNEDSMVMSSINRRNNAHFVNVLLVKIEGPGAG